MEEQADRAAPLEYESRDQESWRAVVRFCAWLAIAQAILELIMVATQFLIAYMSNYLTRMADNTANLVGMLGELTVGITSVWALVAALACANLLPKADRRMLLSSAALVAALVLRDVFRVWMMIIPTRGSYGLLAAIGYAASLATELLIPLLLIWLMRRPEVRRLFAA